MPTCPSHIWTSSQPSSGGCKLHSHAHWVLQSYSAITFVWMLGGARATKPTATRTSGCSNLRKGAYYIGMWKWRQPRVYQTIITASNRHRVSCHWSRCGAERASVRWAWKWLSCAIAWTVPVCGCGWLIEVVQSSTCVEPTASVDHTTRGVGANCYWTCDGRETV